MKAASTYSNLYYRLKVKLLLMMFFLRMFLMGAEYSVVIPTVLLYIESLNGSNISMGLVIAAYPVAAFISLPLFGYLYDKTLRTRELFFLLNLFEVVGNVLYALPYSIWLPIAGRFVAGLGDGFSALAMGEIAHLFPPQSRIGMLSLLEFGRVFGLIIGPTLNFVIAESHYTIYTWELNNKTLPGVIMAFCWFILEILTVLGVYNLSLELSYKNAKSTDKKDIVKYSNETDEQEFIINEGIYKQQYSADENPEEKVSLDDKTSLANNFDTSDNSENSKRTYCSIASEMFCLEILILFYVDLILSFVQTAFEIYLPYITEFDYHWLPKQTSLVYVIGGLELIFIFAIIYLYSSKYKIEDSYVLIFSVVLTQIALLLLIAETITLQINKRLIIFCFMAVIVLAIIPFNLVCIKTLLSKITNPKSQGFVQGFYGASSRVALTFGPIVASASFHYRHVFGIVLSIANMIALVLLFMILDRIKKREKMFSKL